MNLKYKNVLAHNEITDLGSAITIVGLSLDASGAGAFADWLDEVSKFKTKNVTCYVTTGAVWNRIFNPRRPLPADLNIVSFKLDDFKRPQSLIMKRFEVSAKWLDDVVANLG